jgi:multidrug efflux pump subunit AcrB
MSRKLWALLLALPVLFLGLGAACCFSIWSLWPASALPPPVPAVTVSAVYPGAGAQVVADTVAAVIEQQVMGVEGMEHMVSSCTQDGSYTLDVIFQPGTDLDIAQVLVQNRVALAQPILPDVVRQHGVTVKRKSPGVLLIVCLTSPDGSRDLPALSDHAMNHVRDEWARVAGVGDVVGIGQADCLRVSLDPKKLDAHAMVGSDVVRAINEQEGRGLAGAPAQQVPIARQLGELVVKDDAVGKDLVRLKDVADIALGTGRRGSPAFINGKPGVMLCIYPLPQARARVLGPALKDKLEQLRANLPKGMTFESLDFTPNWEAPKRPTTPEYLRVELELPDAASPEQAVQAVKRAETLLREVEGVDDLLSVCGWESSNHAYILVCLAPPGKRPIGRDELTQAIRTQLKQVVDAGARLSDLSGGGHFPGGDYAIDLALRGPEQARLWEWDELLVQRLLESKQLTEIHHDRRSTPGLQFDLNVDMMARWGVPKVDAMAALQLVWGFGADVHINGRPWQVEFETGDGQRDPAQRIRQQKVRVGGEWVSVGEFVNLRATQAVPVLRRLDGEPMVAITADPAAGIPLTEARSLCMSLAQQCRQQLALPAAYQPSWMPGTAGPK